MPRQPRLPILLALACALFLRALVPAGWMPAPSDGAFSIMPCPAADPQPMVQMDSYHGAMADHGSSHHQREAGDGCFSALLIGFAPVDRTPLLPARLETAATPAVVFPSAVPATGPPASPPPATGPPALA